MQKKLEHDLTRPDHINRRIFVGNWCGLITFDELNERLNTTDRDEYKRFDWGSYGDDALYKFLSANAIRWNNGEATRQISIQGVKHRFYLLDDTRSPVPNKSYKDLTPKQIETTYLNYVKVSTEIRGEKQNYINAEKNLPGEKINFMDDIKLWIGIAKGRREVELGKDPKKAYEGIMNGTIGTQHNDRFKRDNIKKQEAILKRGIRTPNQILEDIRNETYSKNLSGLNGENPNQPENKPTQPDSKLTLFPEKPTSVNY